MGNLNLLDLECILTYGERKTFDIERNGEVIHNVKMKNLWSEIHKNKIIKAQLLDHDVVHIIYETENLEENELIIFLE